MRLFEAGSTAIRGAINIHYDFDFAELSTPTSPAGIARLSHVCPLVTDMHGYSRGQRTDRTSVVNGDWPTHPDHQLREETIV